MTVTSGVAHLGFVDYLHTQTSVSCIAEIVHHHVAAAEAPVAPVAAAALAEASVTSMCLQMQPQAVGGVGAGVATTMMTMMTRIWMRMKVVGPTGGVVSVVEMRATGVPVDAVLQAATMVHLLVAASWGVAHRGPTGVHHHHHAPACGVHPQGVPHAPASGAGSHP